LLKPAGGVNADPLERIRPSNPSDCKGYALFGVRSSGRSILTRRHRFGRPEGTRCKRFPPCGEPG